jgi:hypothetical protein
MDGDLAGDGAYPENYGVKNRIAAAASSLAFLQQLKNTILTSLIAACSCFFILFNAPSHETI